MLPLDQHVQAAQRGALGLQPPPARGGRGPLLGVSLQAALHLRLTLGQDATAFGDGGHPHLHLLASAPDPDPPLLQQLPGLQCLLQLGE